jgi:hypothetical protein
MTIGGQASSKRSVRFKPLHAKARSFHGQMNLDAVAPYRISGGLRLQTRLAFERGEQEFEKSGIGCAHLTMGSTANLTHEASRLEAQRKL